jgi:glycosyltransferase involved in cell wall biosynthesis
MKISIITVAYNSAKTIEDTIKSVLSQSYQDIEYLIIDGASKDNTLAIVEKYREKIAKVVSEPDQGIYDAMNKGVALATGDVVGILNSDDFYADDDVLKNVAEQFKQSDIEGLYADLDYVDATDTNLIVRKWRSGTYKEKAFLKGWMPPHPTFFVRKEVYKKFGSYNLSLKSAADYEFMLRVIHKEKIKLGYLPNVIVKMRAGGMSNASFKNRLKANREDRKAWELNGLKPGPFTLIRKPLSKLVQFIKK